MSKSDVVKAASNPMQRPRISKVVVNMSIGKSGEPLQKAMTVLEQLSGQKPCTRGAKKTIRDWGIVKGRPIASIVTLRRDKATDFLKQAFEAVGNRLPKSTFDSNGNFSFGIKEHIEMPGVRYDPALGIFGMDVCITVEKPGYRVKRRCSHKSKVGNRQKITRGEAMGYIREVFDVELVGV